MAFQMSFTDRYGDTYATSYWRPENWNFTKTTAEVTFTGYVDAAHKGGRVIGQHGYNLTADQYAAYIQAAPAIATTTFDAISSQMYALATATLDTNGASFFSGATEV